MGLQVRVFIGSQSPSVFALDAPVISIGCASYCDVNLDLPGIPNIACLIEHSSRNGIYVQTDHSDLVMLASEFLEKSQKKRWQAGQELLIGSSCRIVLENSDSKVLASKSSPSTKTVPSPPPPQEKTSRTQVRRADEDATHSHRTSSSDARPASLSLSQKPDKPLEASSGVSKQQEAVDPQKSSPVLMTLVVITALAICVGMLMVPSTDPGEQENMTTIGSLINQVDETLVSMNPRDAERKNIESIRQQLLNAYSQKNNPAEARRIYMLIKRDISSDINRKEFSSSESDVLKKKILQYVNYQLGPKQKSPQ